MEAKVGSGTAVEWPTGVGAKGNEGVAGNIGQTKNAIGYVEYAYAKQNKLTYAAMINKAGKTVQPTIAAFQAAASNADWAKAPGYYVILTDQPGEASWPITAATFILMHKDATTRRPPRKPSSSSNGRSRRATRWPKSSTTSRCRNRSVKLIEKDLDGRDQELSRSALCNAKVQPGAPGWTTSISRRSG
jgi:phosphate transport system substrate-binding protein